MNLTKIGKKGNLGPLKNIAVSVVVIVALIAFAAVFLSQLGANDAIVADSVADNAIDDGLTEIAGLMGWVSLAILVVVIGFLIGYLVKKLGNV